MVVRAAVLFIALVFAGAVMPGGISAQSPSATMPRIGVLRFGSAPDVFVDAFRRGLEELGYHDGRSIRIEYRWADGRPERLVPLAAELVRLNVDVLVVAGNEALQVAKRTTSMIPIVMPISTDPVRVGLVASLARPGGNITGFASQNDELPGKWLEVLRELFPAATRFAALWDPASAPEQVPVAQRAARALGVQLDILSVGTPADLESIFKALHRDRIEGLVVLGSPNLSLQRGRIVGLAAKHRIPTVYHHREFVTEAGGLVSYGPDLRDLFRRAAGTVDRILKGAKPQDLPVEQPTKFELVVNLSAAKALGLSIPRSILLRADQIIE